MKTAAVSCVESHWGVGNKPELMGAVILFAVAGDAEGTAARVIEEFTSMWRAPDLLWRRSV